MSKQKIALLDGGMGQELYQRGIRGEDCIWSTNGLLKSPDIVRDIHLDFINAGATVITTNTYNTNIHCLAQVGLEARSTELTNLACDLAIEAREQSGKSDIQIAGCLPPLYGTYLPDLPRDINKMRDEYLKMIEVMADKVDVFLCETMTTADEAYAAASAASQSGVPIWVAWTLADDTRAVLRTDESIETALNRLNNIDNIEAYLFNCSIPESIAPALQQLKPLTDKTIGAYANGFAPIPKSRARGDIEAIGKRNFNPLEYGSFVKTWINEGAEIVGGCCEIGPDHIKHLADKILN